MLMPLAMAAIFLRTGMPIQYTERGAKPSRGGRDSVCGSDREAVELRSTDSRGPLSHICTSVYFVVGAGGACSGTGTALSSYAVYHRSSSICDPAARRWMVKSKAAGEPFPVNPPAFSSA